jgi:hypothetical protein
MCQKIAWTCLPTPRRTDCLKGQIRGWLGTANRVNLRYHYTTGHRIVKEKFLFGNIFILVIYQATNSRLPDVYDPDLLSQGHLPSLTILNIDPKEIAFPQSISYFSSAGEAIQFPFIVFHRHQFSPT